MRRAGIEPRAEHQESEGNGEGGIAKAHHTIETRDSGVKRRGAAMESPAPTSSRWRSRRVPEVIKNSSGILALNGYSTFFSSRKTKARARRLRARIVSRHFCAHKLTYPAENLAECKGMCLLQLIRT